MTETFFTKGPWKWKIAEYLSSEVMAILEGVSGGQVCKFGNSETYYPTEGSEPSKPDMLLMGVAPELYEALDRDVARLSRIREQLSCLPMGDGVARAELMDYCARCVWEIEQLLAKARGEVSE